MKIATVCSGIGSPEVALKNLGINHTIIFACEIDKYARETYLANHECETMYQDMTAESWEGEKYYADLMIGGIPCQSFSLAGKRLGELDPRGLLFFDFLRYVKNQQPKYFIIENVKGLLSDNDGKTFQNWIDLLGQSVNGNPFFFPHEDSLMYNLHWQVLNTKDCGLPQNRERVFLVGIRNDLPNTFVFPKGVPLKLRLKDVLEDEVDEKYYLSDKAIKTVYAKEGVYTGINEDPVRCLTTRYSASIAGTFLKVQSGYEIETEIQVIGNYHKSGHSASRIVHNNGIYPSVMENHGTVTATNTNDYRIRKLTPLECFRLQGFPDKFVKPVSNSQLYKQAGNTISVNVIQAILKNLLKI